MSSNLNLEQKEQIKEIGLRLNQIRTASNISLDTVAAKTKITKSLLLAIETANFAELPEPFYIRALVAKFAQAVGANGIEFTLLDNRVTQTEDSPAVKHPRSYFPEFQLRSLHLYLLYVFLVFVSVTGITLLVERPVIVNQTPEESTSPIAEPIEPELEPESEAAPQFISQSSNSNSVTVGINLQERCWLKVMVDGKVAFEGTLLQGTQRQWSGKKEVTIRAGNAGGVVISFNNQQQKILGAPGQVEEITYTIN